jgi:tetratricopeptide (TPR) repeat protein
MSKKEKKIFLFFLVVFFVFCALFAAHKIKSFDIWWHLKTGEWIWQHKAIPSVDPFSYTFRGAKWIDFEWLFQAVIYPIYQLGGFEGLIIFKIVVILLTFVILFLICREVDGGRRWLTVTVLFVALLVARGRFMVRPQIISLLFLAFYFYLLTLHRGGQLSIRQMVLFLLPLHILWVNFHGSFLLGILLTGIYALGRFVPQALTHHRDLKPVFQDKKLQGLLFLFLLLCLASLLNPHTYQAFLIPLKTAEAGEALKGIAEWQPVAIKFLGLFVIERTMWFRALFLLGVASFFINRRNLMSVENVLVFLLFSYMAFKHIRFFGTFAIAVTPIIVYNLKAFRWQIKGLRWIQVLLLLVIVGFCVRDVGSFINKKELGFGSLKYYPEETVVFLEKHGVKGKIFNHYDFGGYIIWRLYPNIPVFIDGRTPTIYEENFFWLYALGERSREVWKQIVERYGVEIVLTRDDRQLGYASFMYRLDEDENWQLVAFDDVSNLYLKKGPKFNKLIEKYGFRYLRPSDITMDYAKERNQDRRYLKALEQELLVSCQRYPRDFYPFYYLGVYHQIYGTRGHFQDAEKALHKAVKNRPHFPLGYYELGFTLMKLERYNESVEALKRAIRLQPKLPADAYYYLGTSLLYRGDVDEAIKYFEKYKKKAGWVGTRVEAYKLLGKAYMKKYKFREAISCYERVRYLEEPDYETFTNMGIAYFGLSDLEKAREFFERAMNMRPDKVEIVYNLAVVYEKLGLTERAQRLFKKASRLNPQTSEEEVWVQRAREKTE